MTVRTSTLSPSNDCLILASHYLAASRQSIRLTAGGILEKGQCNSQSRSARKGSAAILFGSMSTASAFTAAAGGAISQRHAPAKSLQSLPLSGHSCFRPDVTPSNLEATLRHSFSGSSIHATTPRSERRRRAVPRCQAAAGKETVAVTGDDSLLDAVNMQKTAKLPQTLSPSPGRTLIRKTWLTFASRTS